MVRYLYRFGDQESSRSLAASLINEWSRQSGPDDPAVLDAQRHLGDSLRELGQYAAAFNVAETDTRTGPGGSLVSGIQ